MFLLDEKVCYSARDIAAAATCEFALLRALDSRLGRTEATPAEPDPMLERTARLGAAHERRVLDTYVEKYGTGVVGMPAPDHTATALSDAAAATLDAIRAGADVVYQGTFFDGRFLGFCDFLVRENDSWAVYDAKLARSARVATLLQLAAYADALSTAGVPVAERAHLLLGDGSDSAHTLAELVPVYRAQRERLEEILDDRAGELIEVQWGDPRYTACGTCPACAPQVAGRRDLLLVAGMRASSRARLIDAGVTTIDAMAELTDPVPGVAERTRRALCAQAALQVRQEDSADPLFEIVDGAAYGALPEPDPGDVFLDFEGDPLFDPDTPEWGLEYLCGTVTPDETYHPFWAHDRSAERAALCEFLDLVAARRRDHPNMHVYHYAPYEKSALLRLAGRHGVGEEAVDDLLREHVLVDLYPIVRGGLRVGQRSYGLKTIEPLYLGQRTGEVTGAAESIVAYGNYCDLRDAGETDAADEILTRIADYNRADCVSTLRLRNWLLARADELGVARRPDTPTAGVVEEPEPVEARLRAYADAAADRSPDQTAAALMAAAIGYHRRERKPFWWAHFDRLSRTVDEWPDTDDVLVVTAARSVRGWHKEGKQRSLRRHIELTGRPDDSLPAVDAKLRVLYDPPVPDGIEAAPTERGTNRVKVIAATVRDGHPVVTVEEILSKGITEHGALPMALAPADPYPTTNIESAISGAAQRMCDGLPDLPRRAEVDLLRRIPPRTRSGAALPQHAGDDHITALRAAVLDLDDSYLAVQGPPGTGKTYKGAHVVADLVLHHGWRIGVVAQSHLGIEHMLDEIVAAGVPGDRVAKKPGNGGTGRWTPIADRGHADFLAAHRGAGCVIGGTAWDFTNPNRVEPGTLDLLVIDEAGQFSLANTIGVAQSARNLLLLGDPQQLAQVSQGVHPEPVDTSALGWLSAGHDVLPTEFGYFLDRSWRMHPALCARVSELAYEGRLQATERTSERRLDGVDPGVRTLVVDHVGNSTESPEEASAILGELRRLLRTPWTDGGETRPLGQRDVLVVAPYNAQVELIRSTLNRAGLRDVPVGTVDRFQGRQAAVVVLSMTASAASEVPRGMSFLLSRNRLNVAISRGQWQAVIVRSRLLTDYLPSTPAGLAMLGAFMRLCE
ncbi:MAG TPA: TM0106 family RecB-like putative nuclease [Aldersonia sp.]